LNLLTLVKCRIFALLRGRNYTTVNSSTTFFSTS